MPDAIFESLWMPLPFIAAFAVIAAFVGAWVLPMAADLVLKAKKKTADDDWEWFYQDYIADLEGTLELRVAETRESGNALERALDKALYGRMGDAELAEKRREEAIRWAKAQRARAGANKLTKSQLVKLRECGLVSLPDAEILEARGGRDLQMELAEDDEVVAEAMSFEGTAMRRIACAAACAVMFVACCTAQPVAFAPALLGSALLALILACDVRAKLIPREACLLMLPLAALFQLAVNGVEGLGVAAATALVLWALLKGVNTILKSMFLVESMGAGDFRLIPSIAMFSGFFGTLYGFAAMAVVQVVVMIPVAASRFAHAEKGRKWHSVRHLPVPMAPGLAAWWVVGLLTQTLM